MLVWRASTLQTDVRDPIVSFQSKKCRNTTVTEVQNAAIFRHGTGNYFAPIAASRLSLPFHVNLNGRVVVF